MASMADFSSSGSVRYELGPSMNFLRSVQRPSGWNLHTNNNTSKTWSTSQYKYTTPRERDGKFLMFLWKSRGAQNSGNLSVSNCKSQQQQAPTTNTRACKMCREEAGGRRSSLSICLCVYRRASLSTRYQLSAAARRREACRSAGAAAALSCSHRSSSSS